MHFIGIGPNCFCADAIDKAGFRVEAFPFDWVFSSLNIVQHCLTDEFETFLSLEHLEPGHEGEGTHHGYYAKHFDTPVLRAHHVRDGYPETFDLTSRDMFLHHSLLTPQVHEKFVKRCKRMMDLLKSDEPVYLVYYDQYTNDYDDVIKFSKCIGHFPNVKVLGIFGTEEEKEKEKEEILVDDELCRVVKNFTPIEALRLESSKVRSEHVDR